MRILSFVIIGLLVINCLVTIRIWDHVEELQRARYDGEFLEFMPRGVDKYGRVEQQYRKVLKMLSDGSKL